jgi:hypothetical protein
MKNMIRYSAIFLLIAAATQLPVHASSFTISEAEFTVLSVEKYLRTELFMGLSKRDGGIVSDSEWEQFLDEVVTPAFPKGYTVLDADGRFRGNDGKTISEASRVLIILYPKTDKKESRRKIEEIRAAYIKRFEQEAVIRMDLPGSVDVSFQ